MSISIHKDGGIQVRITRNGKDYSKYFSFSKHNSISACIHTAVEYEKKLIEKLGPVSFERNKLQKNNTSGHIGVSRTHQWARSGKMPDTYVWQATWRENGKAKTVRFSENKYGEEIAKELAILSRKLKRRTTVSDMLSEKMKE